MRRALLALALLAGCHAPNYAATYSLANGAALVPPGTSRGTTASIKYFEDGGIIGKGILAMVIATSAIEEFDLGEAAHWESRDKGQTWTHVAERPGHVTINAEKAEQADRDIAELFSSYFPVHFNLEVADRNLGGDTGGYMMSVLIAGSPHYIGGLGGFFISGGLGFGSFTFHDRIRRHVSGDTTLAVTETMGDVEYNYFGSPVRVSLIVKPWLGFHFQADLNWLAILGPILDDDVRQDPLRAGMDLFIGPLVLRAEVVADLLRFDAVTYSLEAGLGF